MSGLAFPKPARRGPKPRKPIARSAPPRRSAKRIPRVTQTARGKEEARLNDLFSDVIRLRDEVCQINVRCKPSGSDVGDLGFYLKRYADDAAHLFPKGSHPRLRWDLRNAVGACRDCHTYMDTHKAAREAFMRSRLTVTDWDDLMRIHLHGPSPDRAEVRATLMDALRNYRRTTA